MTDIVERLRERAQNGDGWTRPVASEAAAEIERMRAALRDVVDAADLGVLRNLAGERLHGTPLFERIRAALAGRDEPTGPEYRGG